MIKANAAVLAMAASSVFWAAASSGLNEGLFDYPSARQNFAI
jgi:hypothetical protein